jgi:hypothetical protein
MMDIKQDLYAKIVCQISSRINEEETSLMKLYLQAKKSLVKVKKLESLKYPSDILMFLDRRKFISPQNLGFLITMLNVTEIEIGSVLQSYYAEITVDDHETDHEEKELTPVLVSEDRSSLLMDNGSCGTTSQNSVCLKTHNKSNNSSKSDD